MLSQFGLERDRSKKKYREFVCRGLKDMKETPFKELYGQVILGREEFMEKAKGLLKGKEMGQEIVERRRLKDYAKPEDLISAVTSVFGTETGMIKAKGGRNNTAKKVAIYLVRRYSGLTNQEIGKIIPRRALQCGKQVICQVRKGDSRG